MRLSEIYRKYLHELPALYSKNEAAQITSMVFESIADIKRADVIKDPAMSLSDATIATLENALSRLKLHEPIQHITGKAWFCDLIFKVSPAVLIPRPETEELVAFASAFITDKSLSVVDIGTGSGCIAITLKIRHNSSSVTAIDISTDALAIAAHNATSHQAKIVCKQINFLDESTWPRLEQSDVIISNPPYIPEKDKDKLDKNVSQFEPHVALFEPSDRPFIFYQLIAKFGKSHLLPGGKIFVEIHEGFGKNVVGIFEMEGYTADLKKDMFGKERFVVAGK